jgi:magnesium transporter
MLKDVLQGNLKQVKAYLESIHGYDLAQSFLELSEEEKEKLYTVITDEKLADLVAYLDSEIGAQILAAFDLSKQKNLIDFMDPDDAADIILELEDEDQEALIQTLGEESDVLSLIQYEEDQTGSAMTNLVVKLDISMDVKKATKKVIQEAPEVETISTLFVVDEENRFVGIVDLKKLLKTKIPLTVKDIFEEHPYVFDKDPIIETISKIRNYAIYEMPVVDDEMHLLGIVTLDDALDIYEEEAKEDFEMLAALPETTESGVIKTALHRIPWLLMLLAISIPISLVTSLFQEIITAVAILVIFQPLISGSAGNVATQTLAVTLRMLSKNEEGIKKNSYREIVTGMINGLIIGLLAFVITLIFTMINPSVATSPLSIAFVVGLSLWLTVLVAPMIAVSIPLILKLIKVDPAVASGPFITTLIDISAITLYFSLATLLLGGV